jgi:hypothetical protein
MYEFHGVKLYLSDSKLDLFMQFQLQMLRYLSLSNDDYTNNGKNGILLRLINFYHPLIECGIVLAGLHLSPQIDSLAFSLQLFTPEGQFLRTTYLGFFCFSSWGWSKGSTGKATAHGKIEDPKRFFPDS